MDDNFLHAIKRVERMKAKAGKAQRAASRRPVDEVEGFF
jgi:hypothetical protein